MIKTFFAVFLAIMCSYTLIDLGYALVKEQQLKEMCQWTSGLYNQYLCKGRDPRTGEMMSLFR